MRDEGVIKFDCRFIEAPPPSAVDDLINFRQQLFTQNLIGVYPDGIGFGNLSKRVGNSRKFIVSASQTGHLSQVDRRHFVTVDDYNITDNWVTCSGKAPASSESLTHSMIYETFPTASAIIHVHNHDAWRRLKGVVPTSRQSVQYGTPEMAMEVQRLAQDFDLAKIKIFVMAGHEDGILTFGSSLSEAYNILLANLSSLNSIDLPLCNP